MYTGLKIQKDFTDEYQDMILSEDHELVKLKKIIDWDEIDKIYKECYPSKVGNSTKETNIVLGLILLKHLYHKSYRKLIKTLHENVAFMYFCSVSFMDVQTARLKAKKKEKRTGKKSDGYIIHHTTLCRIIKRLGSDNIQRIEQLFTKKLILAKIIKGKTLYSDTTSLEKNIAYPTEVGLLKRVIEHAEQVVQGVIKKKDIIKSKVIRKANQVARVYYCAKRKTKDLLNSVTKKMLQIAYKTIEKAEEIIEKADGAVNIIINSIYEKVKTVGKKIVNQVEDKLEKRKIEDRIVSYYEPHVRPLPKGKARKPCEFGTKLRIDMTAEKYITNYHLYQGNPNDVVMLDDILRDHKNKFSTSFKNAGMDRGFYDKQKIQQLEAEYNISLAIPHKKRTDQPLSKRKQKIYDKRARIEAKISEGKRVTGMNKSYYKGFEGDKITAILAIWALNTRQLLRDIKVRPNLMKSLT
jgi:IS5 family transposase